MSPGQGPEEKMEPKAGGKENGLEGDWTVSGV